MTDAFARFSRVDEILEQALERSPGEREAFVEARCGDDPALLADVRRLLHAADGKEWRSTSTATASNWAICCTGR